MNVDHAHPASRANSLAGFLPDLPATVFYFIVIGFFSVTWAVLRGVWDLSFWTTFNIVILPFALVLWLRRDGTDQSGASS